MKKLLAALSFVASPLYAGESIDNLKYTLPDYDNPVFVFACRDKESLLNALDKLTDYQAAFRITQIPPPGCNVFNPPIAFPEDHFLESLFLSDEGVLYGLIQVNFPEVTIWSYIDEEHMVEKGPGDT